MKKGICIAGLLLVAGFGQAQENLGIANSNWAVTNAMRLNPSAMVDPRPWLDINFVGGSFFGSNNFGFLPADSFSVGGVLSGDIPDVETKVGGGRKNVFLNLALWGPAVNLSKGKHSFGAHLAFRNYNNARKVPTTISNFIGEGLNYEPQQRIPIDEGGFNIKTMSWVELGLSYGRILHKFHKDMWMGAVTLKRLIGIHHGAVLFENTEFIVLDSSNAQATDIDGSYAYVTPGWNRGGGWALDIGVTYKKMLEDVTKYTPHSIRSRCKVPDYKYKIGASILDLGWISFGNDAVSRELQNGSTFWNGFDETDIDDFESLDEEVLARFPDNQLTSSNSYTAKMPLAFSVQADYNFENDFYVNATIMQRVGRPNNFGVERANLLGVTPRYERKYFEAAMPIWLHNYTSPRVGLGLRFAYLILGTDNIIPYIFNIDVYNIDFYFGLRYSIYRAPECRNHSPRRRKVLCPAPTY